MAETDLAGFLAGSPGQAGRETGSPGQAGRGAGSPGETARAAEPGETVRRPAAGGTPVVLAGRWEIDPGRARPEFASPAANAYAARPLAGGGEVFALICNSGLPPRGEVLTALLGVAHPGLLKLADRGVVAWPDGAERFALIVEAPAAGRLVPSPSAAGTWTEEAVVRRLLAPVAQALRELKVRRVFHGAINPARLFLRDPDGAAVLGECATAPAGHGQPAAFETIERGMAQPTGRGAGTGGDDLYALGATALALLQGAMPLAGLDDRAVVRRKIERGSLAALAGRARPSAALTDALRGLLADEAPQRWGLEDLEHWLGGRRHGPRQGVPPRRAARALVVAGQEVSSARALAEAIAGDLALADRLLASGELEAWLRRSLDDERVAERVRLALAATNSGRGPAEERRLSRLLTALDPPAPIRYRGRAIMPEGLGGALAEAFAGHGGAQEIAEIIAGQLPLFWVAAQDPQRPDLAAVAKRLDQMAAYLDRPMPGYGIERCLYELNPSMPCASPLLKGRIVTDLAGLVAALEDLAARPGRPREPMDRHIAAFITSRHPTLHQRHTLALSKEEGQGARAEALLDVFADLQRATKCGPKPALAAWLADLAGPALDGFHSRTLKLRLKEALAAEARGGIVDRLLALLRNDAILRREGASFAAARREYALAGRIIELRRRELEDKALASGETGRQVAAVAACLIAAVVMAAIVLVRLA